MRILGVDPGTLKTGAGLIESQGNHYRLLFAETIHLKPSLPIIARLRTIYQTLLQMIREHKPEVLALEDVFYGKNVRSMVKLGEARACAMLAASEAGIDVVEYAPARIKQSVSGNGRATKEQIQHMVKTLLNLKKLPPTDSADALAVALCHLHHHRTRNILIPAASPRSGQAKLLKAWSRRSR